MITKKIEKKRLLRPDIVGTRNDRLLMTTLILLILGFIAAAPPWAHADIPRYINYQGKLTDAEDNPVTGDVSITVRLYDVESSGTALWTETQTVTVTRGVFSMLLGETTALNGLDFNDPYWYSVEVESDGEMTPRQRLTTIAYAINADKLDGYDAADFLMTAPGAEMSITAGANEDITLDPTGLGNIVMKIDSTSGDFKITDGTTNWVLVDNATGNVTIAKNLTVSGTIYGTLASTGGDSTFSSIVVTGTSDLRGNISSSTGAVTVADVLTQSGSANQVTFAGNVDANNGMDVTGALTVSGAATLSSALDMNSNIDLDYSGASTALAVTQASTGAAAQFSGGRVIVGANETTNANALSTGELYVLGDLEVDGNIYGNITATGTTTLGDGTLSSLVVTGTSDLQGNVSDSGGTFTIADDVVISATDTSTSGTATLATIDPTFQDSGTDSTTTAIAMNIAPTVNYTGSSKTGSYTALKITATETSLPTGSNYLIDAYAGDGTAQKFYVDNSGNASFTGTVAVAAPAAGGHAVNKTYADAITPATAGGWTDGGTGVYLLTSSDSVGIGTDSTGTYKLNVAGSANVTSLYVDGALIASTDLSDTGSIALLNSDSTITGNWVNTANPWADNEVADVLTIDGGTIDNSVIGAATPAAATVTGLTMENTGSATVMTFDDGTATDTFTYDSTAGQELYFSGAMSAVDFHVRGSSPAVLSFGTDASGTSLIYDPATDEIRFSRGTFIQSSRNLVKNASFEAFSAFQQFHAYDDSYQTATTETAMGGFWDKTYGYQGGWEEFAPDDWTYVSGKCFQHSPMFFKTEFTETSIDSNTWKQDYAEGMSAVRLEVDDGANPGKIQQIIKRKRLKPSTVYSLGVKIRIDPDIEGGSSAKVDVLGEDGGNSDPLLDTTTALSANITATAKSIAVSDATSFPPFGTILITRDSDSNITERIRYEGIESNQFLKCTRASTAYTFSTGDNVTVAPFTPIETSADIVYKKFEGQFATDPKATEVTIVLSAETGAAFFDTIQLVAGGTVPEYAPAPVVDSGDQTMYGSLRIGRSSDEKGGILSVDKFVRTRGIELFSNDPGLTGASGGSMTTFEGGGIFPPGPGWNELDNIEPSVRLYVSGTYEPSVSLWRDYKVVLDGAQGSTATTYTWYYMDNSTAWVYQQGGTGVSLSTTAAFLDGGDGSTTGVSGVNIYFDLATGTAKAGDTWWFNASSEQYIADSSYQPTSTYTPGKTRIYVDPNPSSPYFNKMVFEDGSTRVSLSDLAGTVDTEARIDYPSAIGGNSYGMWLSTFGAYTGINTATYEVKITTNNTLPSTSPDKFRWRPDPASGDGDDWSDAEIAVTGAQQTLNNGIYVQFGENQWTGFWNAANLNDAWSFTAYAGGTGIGKVDSLNNLTGNLSLQPGSNITLDTMGETITINATALDGSPTNEMQNLFETITVTAQDPLVADLYADTLNIVQGSGITLTTNAATDTLTIENFLGGSIESAEITDAEIVDADISGTANIATSKLSGAVTSITNHGLGTLATKSTVVTGDITDATIIDADISGTANIATSKLADSVDITDAISKKHTQGTDTNLGILASDINMGANKITNLGAPVADTDAATKTYVDAGIAGLSWKEAALSLIANNTLEPPTEVLGNRYVLTTTGGAPHANWDGASAGDMVEFNDTSWVKETPEDGDAVFIEDVDTGYVYATTTWTPFTGASAYSWGTGLTNVDTTISIDSTVATLTDIQTLTNKTLGDGTVLPLDYYAGTYVNEAQADSITSAMITNDEIVNADIKTTAAIATSKLSGAVTSITDHGLGSLATKSTVATGDITDATIVDADISAAAAIATSKLSGAVTSITDHGLGTLATKSAVATADITDGTITSTDINASAGILDSQLATSPATRFYENFAEYVETGLLPDTSINLTSDISLGIVYVRGVRVNKTEATPKLYTASRDTYVDIDSSGDFQYTEVTNDAAAPGVVTNSIRLAKVVTDSDNITAVTDLRSLYPVTANEIAPGAVTSTGIADGSIGTTKLADSAVTSIKIAEGTIVDADISGTAAISTSKISGLGALASLDAVSGGTGTTITDDSITNADVKTDAAIAGTKISPVFGSQNLTISGSLTAATTLGATDSDGYLYLGRDASSSHYLMWDDNYEGTDGDGNPVEGWLYTDEGLSTKYLEIRGASPAAISFGSGETAKRMQFDPSTQEFSFTGGKMKQAFQNLVRGGSFESWDTPGWYSAWLSGTYAYTSMDYAKFGQKSLYIEDVSVTNTAYKSYYISNWDRFKGNPVTLSVWAKCYTGTATAAIGFCTDYTKYEATSWTNIDLTTTWQNFTFIHIVPVGATTLKVFLYGASAGEGATPSVSTVTGSGNRVYYDGVTVVEGNLALEYGPSPILDLGDQVIGGSLAIGADIDPYNDYGTNYYNYPRLVFGEPDVNFGDYYDAYSGGGYTYATYGGGSGEISFRRLSGSSGMFTFNRPIGMDSYEMSSSSWNKPALFIGNLYSYEDADLDMPDYAFTTKDAYIKGVIEVDGGIYGDIMSFYGGVGKSSNLLKYSENFSDAVWAKGTSMNVDTNSGNFYVAPDGSFSACKLTSTVESTIDQTISVTGNTTYNFSVYVSADALNTYPSTYIMLKSNLDADWWTWPNYKWVDLWDSLTWKRAQVSITTPAGASTLTARIHIYGSTNYNTIRVWGAQIRQSDSPGIYLPTTSTAVNNSTALFHGDGSGLTNLSAANVSGTSAITGVSGATFTINEDATSGENMSLTFNRGSTGDVALSWNETGSKLELNDDLKISGTITAGTGPNTITTAVGLVDATKLSGTIPTDNLPNDGYVSTYVNVSGDTMTGTLTVPTIQSPASANITMKLADAAGAYKLLVHDSGDTELFSVASDGAVKISGGYTGTAGAGITLQPNGDIYFDGDLYQTGTKYTVDSIRITGNYDVALVTKLGVGVSGTDEDYLQIDTDGHILDYDGPVTIADALTQTGSSNQVTFQGNVDATGGLDVTGAGLTAANGFTLSGGTLSLPNNAINDDMVSNTLTASDLVASTAVVSDTEVANDITIASSNAGSFAGLTTSTLLASGDITGSATKLDIDKSYTNQTGEVNDHAFTRNVTLDDATSKAISGAVLTINAVDTQTSGTLTDNSTLLKLQTGANVGASGYFIDGQDSTGASKFKVTKAGAGTLASDLTVGGDLTVSGSQIITGTTLYDSAQTIRTNSATALLVEKAGAGGSGADALVVDTSGTAGLVGINKTPVSGVELDVLGDAVISGTLKAGTADAFQVSAAGGITSVGINAGSGLITTSGNISTTGTGVMTSAGLLTASSGINVSGGNITVTDASNLIINTDKFTLYGATGNAIMAGTLTQLRSIGLTPDYDNAILRGDNSNNFGTLSLLYDSTNYHNYYEWTTNEPTTQDYDIVVRYRLPDGFSSFDATTPIKLFNKVSNAAGSTALTVTMLDTAGSAVTLSGGSGLKNTSWTESTITIGGTPTFTAGGYVTITIKMFADQADTVDVGELTLKGNW